MSLTAKTVLRRLKRLAKNRTFRISAAVTFGVLVVINLGLSVYYQDRLYPRSSLAGKSVGGYSYSQLETIQLLPKQVELRTAYKKQTIQLANLDAKVDWTYIKQTARQQKGLLPMLDILQSRSLEPKMSYSTPAVQATVRAAEKYFTLASKDWTVKKENDVVELVKGSEGFTVDGKALAKQLEQAIQTAATKVEVPLKTVAPGVTNKQLQPIVDQLKAKQQLSLVYSYNGNSRKASAAEILSWYDVQGATLAISNQRVSSFIGSVASGQGIRLQNLQQLVNETVVALDKQANLAAPLQAMPKVVKQYGFCVKTRGVGDENIPEFSAKFSQTLNDARGWSLDGQVMFAPVSSGCSFTAWLSAADQVPSFGAVCDSIWSCAVSPNVIINFDRWRYASDAWIQAGGSLDDYRSMVINHETGHWFGFNHRYCAGAGQPAPVMQQQSINLQGCAFNPWPSADEKNTLKAQLGI